MKTKDTMAFQATRSAVGTQSMTPRERQDVRMEALAVTIMEDGLGRRRWLAADRDKIAGMIDEAIEAEIVLRGYIKARKAKRQ